MVSSSFHCLGKKNAGFLLHALFLCACFALAKPVLAAEILFVAGTNPPASGDQVLIDRLTGNGHNVTVVEDSASQSGDDVGKDLILISSTVGSSQVSDKFRFSLLPVVTWEAWIFDDMGMTGTGSGVNYGGEFNQQSITLVGTHTLTALLEGTVQFASANNRVRWGIPSASAVISAHIVGDPSKPVIFHYATGDNMVDGVAPARRLGWFFDNATGSNWNSTAQALFDNMIIWALSPETNLPPEVSASAPSPVEIDTVVQLDGLYTDDGVSLPVTTQWHVDSAPGGAIVTFSDEFDPDTTASFDTEGSYTLRFEASDPGFSVDTTVVVEVEEDAPPPPPGHDVLYVLNLPINSSDQANIDRLEGAGYTVTTVDDDAVETSDANGNDLIVISSTTLSGKVNTKFTNTALPLLVWESALFDDLQLTGPTNGSDYGTQGGQQSIDIIGGGPLAAGLSGITQVSNNNQAFRWGMPSPNAVVTATIVGNASRATIFSYTTGATMVGMTAPAPRVAMFLSNSTAANFTADGQALFDAAIAWLLDPPAVTNQPPEANAGPDKNVTVNVQTTLDGSFVDDGVATPVTATWHVLQTPAGGSAVIDDLNDPASTVTFTLEGEYELELEVDDTEFNDTDTVTITVEALSATKDVLFVTRFNPVGAEDERILFQLEHILNLNVEVVDHFSESEADAVGKDLVIISSTVSSGQIGTTFTNTAVPVLTWEAALLDELGMSNSGGVKEFNVTEIDVVGGAHPLAVGKSGTTTINTDPTTVTYGIPLASADVIAVSTSNASRGRIFSYDAGAQLTSFTAPAKRAYFYLYQDGHDTWTADAQDLFNAAVIWLLDGINDPQLRIMPLGDSITRGKNFTWSYREDLVGLLDADQCRYDMVGTQHGADRTPTPPPPTPGLFDKDHEGHGGFRTDQIDTEINNYLPGNVPDVVLIHLGTNDITQGSDLNQSKEFLRSIITKLRAANPDVTIYLAQIIKRAPSFDATIATYNGLMSDLAAEEDTVQSPVILVDHETGYDNSVHNQADELHPNDVGDALISDNWFNALRPNINAFCAP